MDIGSSRRFFVFSFLAIGGWVLTSQDAVQAADNWKLVVRQGVQAPAEAPLLIRVPAELPEGSYVLQDSNSSPVVEGQVFEDSGRWLVLLGSGALREGRYPLTSASTPGGTTRNVGIVPRGANIQFQTMNRPFTEYRVDAGPKPFLFPLIGPSGASYTRAYPMEDIVGEDRDHPHQRSFWFTHGNVNGIDFWSEQKGHGSIRETSRKSTLIGSLAARLRTTDDWLGPDGKKVCEDERVLTIYATRAINVLDFEIELRAVSGPVTFGDTKEGMFGLRVASSMDVNKKLGGRILNAEGLTDEAAWGKASPWVDYTGPVAGKAAGIAILNHPRSFRHPTTWHVRTYGLFAANPFGWHDFGMGKSGAHTLAQGEKLWFGYRVILHEGDTASAGIAGQYSVYADPASFEVVDR